MGAGKARGFLNLFDLHGKTALVTGSSRGLGLGIARALAEAGARVALHGSQTVPADAAKQVNDAQPGALAVTGDVSDPAACIQIVEQVMERFGCIDILINNAGTIRRLPAAEYSWEDWNVVLETNLSSVFRLSQLAGKHMLAQGSGKIINIASLLTFQGGVTVPAYAAAKGGVGQLTKALANEWASRGVNVNAIAPGIWRRTTRRLCVPIRFDHGKSSNEFLLAVGERRPILQGQPCFWRRVPATTCTVMCWLWMAAGWAGNQRGPFLRVGAGVYR